jgi:hypothetical protein
MNTHGIPRFAGLGMSFSGVFGIGKALNDEFRTTESPKKLLVDPLWDTHLLVGFQAKYGILSVNLE